MESREKSIDSIHRQNHEAEQYRDNLPLYINLKLASTGQPYIKTTRSDEKEARFDEFMELAEDLLKSYGAKNRHLPDYLCPVDRRIQDFLREYLRDVPGGDIDAIRLPGNNNTLVLDKYGVARTLSLPIDSNEFSSEIVNSYRIRQGILHNPANDKRTTEGIFHVAEGGLPIPGDKKAVPEITFAKLLSHALNPPDALLELPYTDKQENPAQLFVSLLLRPVVCPEIPGIQSEKSMEIRCFAPGNLVSNLDFLESIFGNAGNPNLAENDAALDVEHWTGHTGCIILAPHLTQLFKQELGLPYIDDATEKQRVDGMCWQDSNELYNDGKPFKITARDERGVIVTILADNYYGYCKKEVKTQISYAANLYGLAEEEHAGGALVFVGENHFEVYDSTHNPGIDLYKDMITRYKEFIIKKKCNDCVCQKHDDINRHCTLYTDINYPDEIIYIPQKVRMDTDTQRISWSDEHGKHEIKLRPDITYIQPDGHKLELHKHPKAHTLRIIRTEPEGLFCHKPCTVSGGGKSELSKSIDDNIIYSPVYVRDFEDDMKTVQAIIDDDYSKCYKHEAIEHGTHIHKKLFDYSLKEIIKLLTPSTELYTIEYNTKLKTYPPHILAQVFLIKRRYKSEWGANWLEHFSVDTINGEDGHALKVDEQEIYSSYLRVGKDTIGKWNTFKLRQDFVATEKVAMEDDISVSVVIDSQNKKLPNLSTKSSCLSVKLVENCEYRLFQRPDEAIQRGFDKQTEHDLAQPNVFVANFEPLKDESLQDIVEDVREFPKYTKPMRELLASAHKASDQYVISSANPRLINGKPTKNPRYLQFRPDFADHKHTYSAQMGARLARKIPLKQTTIITPVNAVISGRRNNPPEFNPETNTKVRPLAVFNPIHYQELPELFMDFICSVTGKSPSTTGAGSEGALTKGPFNALWATTDLNNALVSFILTGYAGFSSAAGYIGPNLRVDHDISLLVPEIWARMTEEQRSPEFLTNINNAYLEKLEDFEHEGKKVLKSRLGYRITSKFVADFLVEIFDNPAAVMPETMLKPESQDMAVFVDGVNNIVEAQQKAAQIYFDDGSIDAACPPLKALLTIMAGDNLGLEAVDKIRPLFTRNYLLTSDWYQQRLCKKQQREIALWERHCVYLQEFLEMKNYADVARQMDIEGRLQQARTTLADVKSPDYLTSLQGTIGADLLGSYLSEDHLS